MNVLQRAFDEHVADLPRRFLPDLLDRKLRDQGITLSRKECVDLADKILKEEIDHVVLGPETDGNRNITIDFTSSDLDWIKKQFEDVLQDLPQLIQDVSKQISSHLLESLRKRWHGEARRQHCELAAFRRRLKKRWGTGLGMLRMQLTIAREFGDTISRAASASRDIASPKAFAILIKLHARACQVTDEILCLLEGGFADGAMARWRTLHEIVAVAYVIQRHGDSIAERYEEHEAIENRRAALQYQTHHVRLGQPPLPPEDLANLDAIRASLIKKHGADFANPQGWAAMHLQKHDPTFADIQFAAGVDHLAPYYKMASHNVHANPKGVFFKLGLYDESSMLLAGPSNSGLTDPGHATAISLGQVSSTLLEFQPTLDNCVILQVMLALENEIGPALLAAQRELDADHKRFLSTGDAAEI